MLSHPILITGASGYLGRTLAALAPGGLSLHLVRHRTDLSVVPEGAEIHDLDLSDGERVTALFRRVRPGLVIHCAASMEAEKLGAAIVDATTNVVLGCAESGACLLHVSTDALFDGERAPYSEDDRPGPVHPYGRAKAIAEERVGTLPAAQRCIVRTSLITGTDPLDPRSAWVAQSLRAHKPITLFVDELRCPIWVEDLAAALWELATWEHGAPVVHVAGPEAFSRYALGLLVAAHEGLPAQGITPGLSRDQPAARPRDVRLDTRLATRLLRRQFRPVSAIFARSG